MSQMFWDELPTKKQAELTGKIQKLSKKFADIDYTKPAHTSLIVKIKFSFCRIVQNLVHKSGIETLDWKYWEERGWFDSSRPWK